ncbi:low-specificity L-threonine aldolase [Bacillus pseudomycoides]|uniref:Low-specificity L-threonine aldolase n=1 Tax=Bacillus pseudomycoides TaxID=64104 RepID=A0A2B5HFQ1_9BACI|nr:low-specificity L-threonine aldolase [Bacillus pseudomycoides]PDY46833.1 low-specificity L-threonine aldolase [Bacillus pseudomycoides]PEA82514.1 low-specificity L-threonine aldolase [Bacillus pseudomycoides]PED05918.1 low-specificity L-threonine aldolase [Bacillus pseudomycoides]PED71077.1 low-specificity L-threonine aldolase [Bacillus pseudomycoides]PEI37960.1 low-specificity L-threonine aldolase [Bacillus pseudomycoides]
MIELRSDTFTLPTLEMLQGVSINDLGDDVYGEDPTVKELETIAAKIFGKESAIFVPSGTMANLTSIMAHCPRGSKVLVGDESDIYIYEAAGASVCGGIMYEKIKTQPDGRLEIADLENAIPIDKEDPQFALPSLICVENPHNRMGGRVLPLEYLNELKEFAKSNNLPVHMDGARIFNAAVALDISPAEIAQYTDSLQFCLSKGLAAPIGSIVVGDNNFINKVYRLRKMLGGGMRQAGIIAKPGIIALTKMVDRLSEDHFNARRLAQGLSRIDGIECELEAVETNIVFFRVVDPRFTWQEFVEKARSYKLNIAELGHGRIRAVTHLGVTSNDIEKTLKIIREILK